MIELEFGFSTGKCNPWYNLCACKMNVFFFSDWLFNLSTVCYPGVELYVCFSSAFLPLVFTEGWRVIWDSVI